MKDSALVFYSRLPTKNLVGKTRIGIEIGNQDLATKFARCLIEDLLEEYLPSESDKYDFLYYYKGNLEDFDESKYPQVTKFIPQLEGGLSIDHIHKLAAKDYKKVVIVGSDIPLISKETIKEAFGKLDDCDIVIVPVKDGGYGLIGMNGYHDLYSEITNWESNSEGYALVKETLALAEKKKLKVHLLPETYDVDFVEDLKQLKKDIAAYDIAYLNRSEQFFRQNKNI